MSKAEIVQDENTPYATVRPPLLTYHSATCDLPSLRNPSAEISILFLLLYPKLTQKQCITARIPRPRVFWPGIFYSGPSSAFCNISFALIASLVHCKIDIEERWSLGGFTLQILCLTTDKSPLHAYVCQFRLIRNSLVLNILQLIAGLVPTLVQ